MAWNPGYGYPARKRPERTETAQPTGTAWQRFMESADSLVWLIAPLLLVGGFLWVVFR